MAPTDPSSTRKPLSRTHSRILLTTLIVLTVFLAYLAASGIRAAGENEEFQKAMEALQEDGSLQLQQQAPPDSANQSGLPVDSMQ